MNKATRNNLRRENILIKDSFVKCSCCGNPLPSWIEISLTDFCNRHCVFCPRSNKKAVPNQRHLFMSSGLIEKIAKDITDIEFKGTIQLAGFGEPLFAPTLMEAIKKFSSICRVEIVTNGDLLTTKTISQMIDIGISFIAVSVYDSIEQNNKLKSLFENIKVPKNKYILRDRWYNADKDFGLKLTNRAGLINVGNQPPIDLTAQCYYTHYFMKIDWNGDVLLCPHDWNRKIRCGNIAFDSIHDVWMGSAYKKYRDNLFNGNRSIYPCSECNCPGIFMGKKHAIAWHKRA